MQASALTNASRFYPPDMRRQIQKGEIEITRMDFVQLSTGEVQVNKLHELPRRAIVIEAGRQTGKTLEEMLTWCQQNGWHVRRWPGGARAWKGNAPRPVREAWQIIKLRDQLRDKPPAELQGQAYGLNLAYDL